MNAAVDHRQLARAETAGAVVIAAAIVAGHDGAAELMVRLRHENGAEDALSLDPETGFDLLRAAGAASLDALVGRPWLELLKGL